jgi:hypothetical protein
LQTDNPIHVITVTDDTHIYEKPPDYDMVANLPPTYDDAIKLSPAAFLTAPSTPFVCTETPPASTADANANNAPNSIDSDSHTLQVNNELQITRPSSSTSYQPQDCVLPNEVDSPPAYVQVTVGK